MALTPNDEWIMDDFQKKLTDRLIADQNRTVTPEHRARSAKARGKAKGIVGADAEYDAAVAAAHRDASWQTG